MLDDKDPNRSSVLFDGRTAAEVTPPHIDQEKFEPVTFKVFEQHTEYSAARYADLLSTFSPVKAMETAKRIAFLGKIRGLIDGQFDGQITKTFAMSLAVNTKC